MNLLFYQKQVRRLPTQKFGEKINRESSILAAESDSFFADRLIFYGKNRPKKVKLLTLLRKQERLKETLLVMNRLRKAKTPTIVRKPKGWLEGIIK